MRIKNFTLLTLALLLMSVVAFAQKPNSTQRVLTPKQQILQAYRTGQLTKENASAFKFAKPALPQNMQKAKANKQVLPVTKKAPGKGALGQKLDYEVSPRMFNQQALRSARRAASDYPIITEAPAGETKTYKRAGSDTYVSSGSAYMGTQSGTMEIVFTSDNEVYMKNPVCGFDSSVGADAYVKGTLSGNTITVPLGQNLYYSSDYDAAITTCMADVYTSGSLVLDKTTTEITYTIDGETITQNGTSQGNALTCYWTDDDSWTGFSEWETVLTEFVAPTVVTPPAGLVTENWTIARYFYNGQSETGEEKVLQVGFDGNDVYVNGFSYYMDTDNWIKGTLSADGKSITFASGQYYGVFQGYDLFFAAYDLSTGDLVPVTVAYDAEAGTMTWPETAFILENGAQDEMSMFGYFTEIPAMVKGTAPDPLPAPDIITSEWFFKSQLYDSDSGEFVDYNLHVNVGIAGTDVFVQGISEDLPNAWIKGTLDPATNKVTFPTGQYLGQADYLFWVYDYYFAGYGMNGMEDVVMAYDPEAKTLTMDSPDYLLINAAWLLYDPNLIMTDVQMQEIADVAATPAQPTITKASLEGTSYPNVTVDIPDTDVDGNPILVGKLSYQYFTDVNHTISPLTLSPSEYMYLYADMTEIPYTFTDDYDIYNFRLYLNQDFSTWNKLGIQSIYRGGGEEHKSEIFWYTFVPYPHQVTFVAANDLSIQNSKATVTVNGKKAAVDAEGKLEVPETYTVTITAAKGYRFVSASSTDATVTLADDLFSATFEMPTKDATINYQLREMDGEIVFATEGQYTIQGGQASVLVGDADVTKNVDDKGKLIDIAPGSTITINAAQGYKLASVEASYTPKSTGGGGAASEIEIGSGDDLNSYVPTYSLYNYSLTQQIYTAAEIGTAGTINSIAFFNGGTEKARNIDLYLVHTTKSTFDGANDWIAATANDKVFSGEVTFTADGEWTTITLDTPFSYNGTDNLAVIVDDNSGNWSSGLKCNVFDATNQAIRVYSDENNYDPANPAAYTGTIMSVKNQIKLGFSGGTAPAAVGVDVALAKKGNTASFIMPGPGGKVNVTYEIVRLGTPINVPAGAYITYYTDKDVLIYDADCELMTVTGINANEAVVTPLKVVAANTPMLVYNSGADKEVWMVPAEETVEEPAADEVTVAPQFKGTLTEKTFTEADMAAKDYFACNGASFAWVRGAGTIGANKCWLEFEKDAMQSTPSLAIVYGNGGTTGINTANGKMETEGQYYDLNGRKLNAAPTQKGVYIINGKKAVIK